MFSVLTSRTPSVLVEWSPTISRFIVYLLLLWLLAQFIFTPRRPRRNLKVKGKPVTRTVPAATRFFEWAQGPSQPAAAPKAVRVSSSGSASRPTPPVKVKRSKSGQKQKNFQASARQEKTPVYTYTHQPFDAFLVLDVEGTCEQGKSFEYPNEIIEFPFCVLRWTDETRTQLHVVDTFKTYVKPTYRTQLTEFCTQLTGISQTDVDAAPTFTDVLDQVSKFLIQKGLVDGKTGEPLLKFCWCTDGPWDIRDFVVKQCFISKIPIPPWLSKPLLDVRSTALLWKRVNAPHVYLVPFNISAQLSVLGLEAFQGRQHSGIDDARNISRILTELALRGVRLLPTTMVDQGRRWNWMGESGEILEENIL